MFSLRYIWQCTWEETSPLWWFASVLFDKQIKHSPHCITCTETIPLCIAHTSKQRPQKKNVMQALVQLTQYNVHVVSCWMATVWVSFHYFEWAISATSWIQGQGGTPSFLSHTITTPGIPAQDLSLCVEGYSPEYSVSSWHRLTAPFTHHLTVHLWQCIKPATV